MKAPTTDFGVCPTCHAVPELVNDNVAQFAVCRQHRLAWLVCEWDEGEVQQLGDPASVEGFTLIDVPHFPGGEDPDNPVAKDVHASMKARRARMDRRLGDRG